MHDVWHVLNGYGRDHLGEVCMISFTYQETGGIGWAVVAATAWLRCRGPAKWKARSAIVEARRRGSRAAAWLPGLDYEKLLFEPLESARARLGLTPPKAYEAVPEALRDLSVD